MHVFQTPLYDQMRERDQDFYDRLEAAGFDHDWGDDGSGLFMKYLRRGLRLLHRRRARPTWSRTGTSSSRGARSTT